MAVSHHHDVLVLMVVGAPVCKRMHRHTHSEIISLLFICQMCVCVCVLWLPNEQLSKAPLDGTVSVRALADEVDVIDVILQGLAMSRQVTQLSYEDDFVTVVQGS